jgi:acetoin utilization deacetylase AcuC-like enzyme
MTTLLITQTNYDQHQTPQGHPERAERLKAVSRALELPEFGGLKREAAASGDLSLAELVHSKKMMDRIRAIRPAEGIGQIDEDTFIGPVIDEVTMTRPCPLAASAVSAACTM